MEKQHQGQEKWQTSREQILATLEFVLTVFYGKAGMASKDRLDFIVDNVIQPEYDPFLEIDDMDEFEKAWKRAAINIETGTKQFLKSRLGYTDSDVNTEMQWLMPENIKPACEAPIRLKNES